MQIVQNILTILYFYIVIFFYFFLNSAYELRKICRRYKNVKIDTNFVFLKRLSQNVCGCVLVNKAVMLSTPGTPHRDPLSPPQQHRINTHFPGIIINKPTGAGNDSRSGLIDC